MEPSVIHNTFVIERNYPTTAERLFSAFAEPLKKRRWFVESDHTDVEEFELDFHVGGAERSRVRFKEGTLFPGVAIASETIYQDIVPNRRIVSAATMTFAERRISASLVTIELLPAEKGTDLICTHQGVFFEGADGPEMRQDGWRKLLDRLAPESLRA